MKITFKVTDVRTKEDITNSCCWVLKPDGSLCYNLYGDLIEDVFAKAIISIIEE